MVFAVHCLLCPKRVPSQAALDAARHASSRRGLPDPGIVLSPNKVWEPVDPPLHPSASGSSTAQSAAFCRGVPQHQGQAPRDLDAAAG